MHAMLIPIYWDSIGKMIKLYMEEFFIHGMDNLEGIYNVK